MAASSTGRPTPERRYCCEDIDDNGARCASAENGAELVVYRIKPLTEYRKLTDKLISFHRIQWARAAHK